MAQCGHIAEASFHQLSGRRSECNGTVLIDRALSQNVVFERETRSRRQSSVPHLFRRNRELLYQSAVDGLVAMGGVSASEICTSAVASPCACSLSEESRMKVLLSRTRHVSP